MCGSRAVAEKVGVFHSPTGDESWATSGRGPDGLVRRAPPTPFHLTSLMPPHYICSLCSANKSGVAKLRQSRNETFLRWNGFTVKPAMKSSLFLLFAMSLFVGPNGAFGQGGTCNTDPWPEVMSCYLSFNVWPGDHLPAGGHCWCDGVPRVSAFCYIPTNLCAPHDDAVCPTCPKAASPIALSTGNTYIEQADIRVPGLSHGLFLNRVWNSRTGSAVGIFGAGWRSTYEENVYLGSENYVRYWRGDDSVWSFGFYGFDPAGTGRGVYSTAAPANQGAFLLEGVTYWTLTFKDGEKRFFDMATGHLTSIVDRNGNTVQVSYDGSGRPGTITDAAGRHLYFNYGSTNLVQTVTTDFGISLSYTYDAQQRLTKVTYPDGSFKTFDYDANSFITAVRDAAGKILESHTYNTCGQGLSASRAIGVEALNIDYPLTCNLELP